MTRNTPPRSSGSSGGSRSGASGKGSRKGGAGKPGQVARPRWGKPFRPAATDREGFTAQTAERKSGDEVQP
ncbi:hypothetical protein ACWC5I_32350 [Kitasatospora sp. NPDC001574]